jgi:SAM-dependent methyltransferase
LEKWRREHHHDTPPYPVTPSPTSGHSSFAENEISFFESGKHDLALILALSHRIGRPAEGFCRCLEFGCGVGRVTAQLAATFSDVLALDISRPHLRLAQGHLAGLGHTNVGFLQVTPEDLHPGTGYDLWFSRLVLQHNPPPVTLEILNRMFAGLGPGGVAIFHVPTYHNGYYFKITDYLADSLPPENVDMIYRIMTQYQSVTSKIHIAPSAESSSARSSGSRGLDHAISR